MSKILTLAILIIFSGKVDLLTVAGTNSCIALPQEDSIVKPGALPVLISSGFKFTEGPAVDRSGNIFFTDQPNDKIWKYSTSGDLSLFLEHTGRSNGLYFDRRGNIIACADANNELWSINRKGKVKIVLKNDNDQPLNGPNDLWINRKGDIYFTDPFYQRDYWPGKRTATDKQKVYILRKGAKLPVEIISDLVKPNGIAGTPDGKYLYIADIGGGKTYRFTIRPDGSVEDKQLFVSQGSDGLTLDDKGNVYLTGKGVTVYDPAGRKIRQIDIPAGWTSNVCFGGANRDILFITATESIFILPMLVKGVE